MPISISNSKERIPDKPLGGITLSAFAVTLLLVGEMEAFWRMEGHVPSAGNELALWSYYRHAVANGSPKTLVMLGTSRSMVGLSIDTIQNRLPGWTISQLSTPECVPAKMLEDLADDSAFRGVILCEISEFGFVEEMAEKYARAEFLDFYHHHTSRNTEWNGRLEAGLQEWLCIRNPSLALDKFCLRWWKHGNWPRPWMSHVRMRANRQQLADYSNEAITDASRERMLSLTRNALEEVRTDPASPEAWLADAMRIESAVQQIHEKGGEVAFVRFPVHGEMWEIESKRFPKTEYWDRFATTTSAVTIHFQDVPSLSEVKCPDDCHIDFRDSPEFTGDLCDELVRRGLLKIKAE